ncbi:hypothetical protein L6E12_18500 [Actinokineospora sp. PR83]|nr:hypothetical protein [Actinokineospora sp. PR83]MCG8917773.1 hypothetical protein [Actinokineospora sp. PR83]
MWTSGPRWIAIRFPPDDGAVEFGDRSAAWGTFVTGTEDGRFDLSI